MLRGGCQTAYEKGCVFVGNGNTYLRGYVERKELC